VPIPRTHAAGTVSKGGGDRSGTGVERELREVHRLYTEMGATWHVERLARELAELTVNFGDSR